MYQGHFFSLDCFDDHGQRLTPRDLEHQLKDIVREARSVGDSGIMGKIAVLTGGDRDAWAEARATLMRDRVSAASLEKIERAAFVVSLDEKAPECGPADASAPCPVANALIHGSGANRWFDKSFTLVVFGNGKSGLNVEHSFGDAPVSAHMMEWALAEEFMGPGFVLVVSVASFPQVGPDIACCTSSSPFLCYYLLNFQIQPWPRGMTIFLLLAMIMCLGVTRRFLSPNIRLSRRAASSGAMSTKTYVVKAIC